MSGVSGHILSPLVGGITWPANRFAATNRTYNLSLPPSDVSALIRGGVPLDPLFRKVGDGYAQSARPELVARVWDRRFEMYVSGKFASGIGLIAAIEETPDGSRVMTTIGWTGPTKWVMPAVTVVALLGGGAMALEIPDVWSAGGSDLWARVGMIVLCVGGQAANLITRERRARQDDLPMLFARLEELFGPHKRAL